MALELPNLPYAHDALAEAGMSKETLEFHHDLHHKAYVDNGNKLLAGSEWEVKKYRRNYYWYVRCQCKSAKWYL
jgi:Fe-Mn family superoxide dismutase